MDENRFVERTLVLLKPDSVSRGICGQILSRFERAGLKLVGLKLLQATKAQLDGHFPVEDLSWIEGMGKKSLENYHTHGVDPEQELGTSDPKEIGKIILDWNYQYLLSGPVVAIVLEGVRAISVVRKLVGATIPTQAVPGTIRGDFSINSADFSNALQCSCKNVVHASGNQEEAEKECSVWFSADELVRYQRADENAMFRIAEKE